METWYLLSQTFEDGINFGRAAEYFDRDFDSVERYHVGGSRSESMYRQDSASTDYEK